MKVIRSIAILLLLSATALAQEFLWEIFKPRTLKEVIGMWFGMLRSDQKEMAGL